MTDRIRVKVPTINPDGTITHKIGDLVKVVQAVEPWAEYSLEDGTRLRMKQTIVKVVKLDDKDDNGDPVYSVESQQTLSVIPQVEE
jgi:hypothetical protein